jgi:ABC-type arginine transport system permease subunit
VAGGYTTVLRGVPDLIVILLIYYGGTTTLTKLSGSYFEVEPFSAGVVALGVICGAYMTEVFRGAIQAVPKGQVEAARSMGLNGLRVFLLVILPQAWRFALPSYGNQWLILLKHTSLISVVGLEELMRKSVIVAGATRQPFTIYCSTAFVYLTMTLLSMHLLHRLERSLERGHAR